MKSLPVAEICRFGFTRGLYAAFASVWYTKRMKNAVPHPRSEWKRELLRLPWLLLIPLAVLLPRVLAVYPAFVERVYSQTIYPPLHLALTAVFGVVPISVAEWLLYAVVLFVPVSIIVIILRALLRKIPWVRVFRFLLTLLIVVAVAFNVFYLLWGFNYVRPTLAVRMGLEVRDRPETELEALCSRLAADAVRLRAQVPEDHGVFTLTDGARGAFREIPAAYAALSKRLPQFTGTAARPKVVVNSRGLSWAGIAGIFMPFTAEANVNVDQPALLIPSSGAHESAHSLGIAREDEANFAAYLACSASSDPSLAYSGTMLALIHSGNVLYDADPRAYAALYGTYSAGMLRDLADYDAYWKKYNGPMERAINDVNDNYLKFNQQQSGVQGYGEMVDLLLAYFAKQE